MKTIKLTVLNFDFYGNVNGTEKIWINTKSIFNFRHFERGEKTITKCTQLVYQDTGLTNSTMYVEETPEQIFKLID